MKRLRSVLADHLMAWAYIVVGWLDPAYVPKLTPYSFTFERGRGLVIHETPISNRLDHGCRLFYLNDTAYARAHTDAENQL